MKVPPLPGEDYALIPAPCFWVLAMFPGGATDNLRAMHNHALNGEESRHLFFICSAWLHRVPFRTQCTVPPCCGTHGEGAFTRPPLCMAFGS